MKNEAVSGQATLLPLTIVAFVFFCACTRPDDAPGPEGRSSVTGIRYLAEPVSGDFERVTAVRTFEFPRDHGAHAGYRTEWWYFTGNLFDDARRHFGFELTFFRVGLDPGEGVPAIETEPDSTWTGDAVWMAHFALTDTESGEFRASERLSRSHSRLAYARTGPFALRIEDWYAEEAGADSLRLVASTADGAIDLTLDGLDRIVLQGDRGYDPKGPEPGNASYYYSAPRLSAAGQLKSTDGATHTVGGNAWLDREWGTSALSPDIEGWDWFALQLGDGRDVMYYRLRGKDGSTSPFSNGSITDASGESRRLLPDSVELEPIRHWRSVRSGIRYPVAWRLSIPDERLALDVTPYLDNQEIDLSVRYWEGAVRITGQADDTPIEGNGYLELAGY